MDTALLDGLEPWTIRDLALDARYLVRPNSEVLFDTWMEPMDEAQERYERTVLHEGGPTERSD